MNLLFAGNYILNKKQKAELQQLGLNIYVMEDEQKKLPIKPNEIDLVVCNYLFVHYDISIFTKLKYVQLLSAGLDRMPVDYAKDNGIIVKNARGVYSIPMAEYALLGVLQLEKQTRFFYDNQRKGIWEKNRNIGELSNKTACILGLGSVGHEVAKRFSTFCKEIIGVDIINKKDKYIDVFFHFDEIENAISNADIIIITLPLLENTKYLVNKRLIQCMKKKPIIVNISRGKVVKETDIIFALENGDISGAVLDVFENEPLPKDNPLWKMDNIIITPHNSFVSIENDERMWKILINNIKDFIDNGN